MTSSYSVTRGAAILQIVVFGALLVGVFVTDLRHGTYGKVLAEHEPSLAGLADGSFARQVDGLLARESWTMRRTRPFWNELMLSAFSETPKNVVAGKDGWLFGEVSLGPLEQPLVSEGVRAVAQQIHESLERWGGRPGAKHLILILPAKWRLHEEMLLGPAVPPCRRGHYASILAELRALGLEAPDVLQVVREADVDPSREWQFYSKSESHMTPSGLAFVTWRLVAPFLGVSQETARETLEDLATEVVRESGNLTRTLSLRPGSRIGRTYANKQWSFPAPRTTNRPGADLLVLGDSYTYYSKSLFPRLVEYVSGFQVDGRFPDWEGWATLLESEKQTIPVLPRFLIFAISETGCEFGVRAIDWGQAAVANSPGR